MSPENQGVFQLLKEVTFRRILAFYISRKWDHYTSLRADDYFYLMTNLTPLGE